MGGPSLLLPDLDVPSALLYTTATGGGEGEGEAEPASLATEVRPGEAYTLLLDDFPPAQLLSLWLTPPTGPARLLGLVGSSSSSSSLGGGGGRGDGGVRWRWRVAAGTPPGEYFIEATSQRGDAFAYSQAFWVVV